MKLLNHKHLNDEVLWQQFKQGSRIAFAQLFKKYYADLYKYGLHLVRNREEFLKDTIQDLFADLWDKREKLGNVQHVKTYLFRSFRRNLLRGLKKQRRFVFLFDNAEIQPNAFDLSMEDLIIAGEMSREKRLKVAKAIEGLTTSQREIIYLKFRDNLDYEEIEEITSLKYQSIRNSVHRALKVLKEASR
ncbi:MAG: RNA polymerase sigma factor [Chitinophagales bacterium]